MDAFHAGSAAGQRVASEDLRVPGTQPQHAGAWVDEQDHQATQGLEATTPAHAQTPAAVREQIAEVRATASAAMLDAMRDQAGDERGRWKLLNELDRIDDPIVRAKVRATFARQTGQSLEAFIQGADWHGEHDKQQALDLVSTKRDTAEHRMQAMTPEKRAKLARDARGWATQLLNVTNIDAADGDESARRIFAVLGERGPEEIEAIRAAVREQTKHSRAGQSSIYQQLDRSQTGSNKHAAIAGLSGNPALAATMAILNAGDDRDRVHDVMGSMAKRGVVGEAEKATADGAHIADLLQDPTAGFEMDGIFVDKQSQRNLEARTPERVIEELRGMSPAEIAAARTAWDASHPAAQSWDAMIAQRFGSDHTTRMRLQALTRGDRVGERALALREAMRTHDQAQIEAALADPDLDSKDPTKRAVAQAERLALDARLRELDAAGQRATAQMTGQDPSNVVGRGVHDLLDAHYEGAIATAATPASMLTALRTTTDPDGERAKRAVQAKNDAFATAELAQTGRLSTVTELRRADTRGDMKRKAQLLDGVATNEQLEAHGATFRARYGADLLADRDTANVQAMTTLLGGVADEAALTPMLATQMRDGNELRVEHVRRHGVRSERPEHLQQVLEQDVYELQHSDDLEGHERFREHVYGKNAGIEDLARSQLALSNDMLASGASHEDIQHQHQNVTATLEVQREEKIRHGEALANAGVTFAKLGAMFVGNPWLAAALDSAASVGGMALKHAVMGEGYETASDDLLTAGISSGGNLLGARFLHGAGTATTAKATSSALRANVVTSLGTTTALGIAHDESPSDLLASLVRTGLAITAPQLLSHNVGKAIGDKTKVQRLLRTGAEYTTEVGANLAIGGSADGASVIDALGNAGANKLPHGSRKQSLADDALAPRRTTIDPGEHPMAMYAEDADHASVAASESGLAPVATPSGPREWARRQQELANARENLTHEQRSVKAEIDALALRARTPVEWDALRAREHDHDLPISMRISPHDEQAALDAMKRQTDVGVHPDGTPITATEHRMKIEQLEVLVKRTTTERSKRHAEKVARTREQAEATYRERDRAFFEAKVRHADTISVESATIGLGLSGTAAANANPLTRELDEHGMPRNLGIGNARKDELWRNMPAQEPIGQPARTLERGLPGIEAMAEHPTSQNARAGEAAAAVANNRARSEITSLEVEGPLAPFEFPNARYVDGKLVELGPIMTSGDVQVGTDEVGLPIFATKQLAIREALSFNGGIGPPRELSPDERQSDGTTKRKQISREDADALKGDATVRKAEQDLRSGVIGRDEYETTVERAKSERVLLSGEEALAMDVNLFADDDVLVIGPGPTAKWAGDHVLAGGARSVTNAGPMPRPLPGTDLFNSLTEVERNIQQRLADPGHTTAEMEALKRQHHAIVATYISNETALMKRLEAALASGAGSAEEHRELEILKSKLDPWRGSRLDRNEASLNNPAIEHIQMDVLRVDRLSTPDGERSLVTFVDGTQTVYDRVVPGIGADAESPGGLDDMLQNLPRDVKFLPIVEDGRPVGLVSDPAGIEISGAAAVGTVGKPSRRVYERIPVDMRDEYVAASREWAVREGVSHGSFGVVPGIENVGENPALMQISKQRSPEEQDNLRSEWLKRRATERGVR